MALPSHPHHPSTPIVVVISARKPHVGGYSVGEGAWRMVQRPSSPQRLSHVWVGGSLGGWSAWANGLCGQHHSVKLLDVGFCPQP